ncbi:MAG: UDP-N-acetylmuramoyl-L-alanyl-D-glutamate--2,6-diaminopimelate ligase [Lachnospiraceae bacterium]|jgi:UDP-N-acetylmuramoyl-L-alanyl-D-glutamate--2,6-diaminopimelate ligase|nr:UDP-N-acetylmuramoyl-L-alanyl-D-glutamate--2,6-diaminopimelate ligase [Lachnospiraceae bacterium]
MKELGTLLEKIRCILRSADGTEITDSGKKAKALAVTVTEITNDSRNIVPGSLFFCIAGAKSDGHDFASAAIARGAAVLVVQHAVDLKNPPEGTDEAAFRRAADAAVLVEVQDSRYAMAFISAAWYGNPADRLRVIGVTGTKGKTTTTYLIKAILEEAGLKVGLAGTIETIIGDRHIPASNTTPESIVLQKTFREMEDAGISIVVMEVSSQALKLHRTQGFTFDTGVFTNISPDHIGANEHANFEEYLYCKSLLFRQCRHAFVNGDDGHCGDILKACTCPAEIFGLTEGCDLRAEDLKLVSKPGELGISFRTEGHAGGRTAAFGAEVPTPGKFSVYNALCAIAVAMRYGATDAQMQDALGRARVRGRIEMVHVSDDFTLLIDYAHNAVALESLLTTLREYRPHRLVCMFGCGGNRSKLRRYEMGEISGKLADFTIITSDNPRDEEPLDIIHDIETGIKKTNGRYTEIPDRRDAIRYAIRHGEPGDIVILAGKGHEDYQEIKGRKYPMDERVIIEEILQEG